MVFGVKDIILMKDQIKTRFATEDDASDLCAILNQIIKIGGTTAFEKELNETSLCEYFVTGPDCISCLIAHTDSLILGFQALSFRSDLPVGWADIATFARTSPKVKGVGTALFKSTLQLLKDRKYTHINASIRADNRSGLAYYTKMGFTDYTIRKGVPLLDGTLVDRIQKKFKI